MATDAEMDAALMEVIDKMSLTWTCMDCGRQFPNRPDSEQPHAFRTKRVGGRHVIAGDICLACYEK